MEELAALGGFVPFDPRILAVVETCEVVGDYFERLALLAHANYVAGLNLVGRDVEHLAVDGDVAVEHLLTGCCAGGSDAEAVNHVVETALKELEQDFTGDALHGAGALEEVAELLLENAIGVLGFLLLAELNAVLGGLAALVLAVLAGGIVAALEGLVLTEDGLAELACDFGLGTYVSCHFV